MSSFAPFVRAATIAALSTLAVSSHASPALPEDAPVSHYGLAAQDLHDFHGGIHGSFATRNVKKDGYESEMDYSRINAYLGYDLARALTVYALAGVATAEDSDEFVESDSSFAMGAGLWWRVIDDDEIVFLPTVSRYRLNYGAEYSYSDAADLAWHQVDSFLTFEIINENLINNEFFPATVSIFAGPVFSWIDMDGYKRVSDNEWGLTVGGSFTFGQGVFVNGGCDVFNDDSCGYFTVGVRF